MRASTSYARCNAPQRRMRGDAAQSSGARDGTHSPWVSRLMKELGREAIVAQASKVRLMGQSRKKDDRLDARTLARLARIDPGLLGPSSIAVPTSMYGGGRRRSNPSSWHRIYCGFPAYPLLTSCTL